MSLRPTTLPELCEAVRSHACVIPRGGGSKPALTQWCPQATLLELSSLSGMLEYEPDEYTFTAMGGTPLREVEAALASHGQYLPFDPPLSAAGATLGGTLAAAMNGAGRLRYGGVRDFIIGLAWVDGSSTVRRGGGKVVKNAAGFDFPKFFCGSLGCMGIVAEVSLKVFPAPAARASLVFSCRDMGDAAGCAAFICSQSWEVEALELLPGAEPQVIARFMGNAGPLEQRLADMPRLAGRPARRMSEAEADAFYAGLSALNIGAAEAPLARVAMTMADLPALERALPPAAVRHYSMAGHSALISGVEASELHVILTKLDLTGLVLRGACRHPRLGLPAATVLEAALKKALDPAGRFPDINAA